MTPRYIDDYPYVLREMADQAAESGRKHPSPGVRDAWNALAEVLEEAATKANAISNAR